MSYPELRELASPEIRQAVNDLCGALEQDPRVLKVKAPTLNPNFTGRASYYPDWNRTQPGELLVGSDRFQVIDLSDPILFQISIPKKNQPKFHGRDAAAEEYFVAWDGVTIFVLWRQKSDSVPISGGQVVADILSSALTAKQMSLYVQACRPECDDIFFHTGLHVYASETDDDGESGPTPLVSRRSDEDGATFFVPPQDATDDFSALIWLHLSLGIPGRQFAEIKNIGRRILDIESSIRKELAHLLGHYYQHASITASPFWRSLKDRWNTKRWRPEARKIHTGLWLSLANLESLRRRWEEERRDFEENRRDYMQLFEVDYADDAAHIESLDIGHVDATMEQISRNLDNRSVVIATIGGAIAGGLAGALIGLVH